MGKMRYYVNGVDEWVEDWNGLHIYFKNELSLKFFKYILSDILIPFAPRLLLAGKEYENVSGANFYTHAKLHMSKDERTGLKGWPLNQDEVSLDRDLSFILQQKFVNDLLKWPQTWVVLDNYKNKDLEFFIQDLCRWEPDKYEELVNKSKLKFNENDIVEVLKDIINVVNKNYE